MRSSPDPEAERRRKGQVWVLALIVASLILRVAIAALTPPLRVETYYWTWSQEPAWGYTDHPPMAAVIIGFLSPLLGHSVLGIRLGPIVLSTVAALIFWRLALRLVTPRAALASLSVLLVAPFWFPFGIVAGGRGKGGANNPLLSGDDDFVVTVDETRLPGAADFLVVPVLHTFFMDDPTVRECTLRFLQHGHFVSEDRRQPIQAIRPPS